jgi:hypothetical protein
LHDIASTQAWGQKVAIDYSSRVYYDQALSCPTVLLIDKYTDEHIAESTLARGFDQNTIKHTTKDDVGTNVGQTTTTPVSLVLPSGFKYNLTVGQEFVGDFAPSTSAFTNFGRITTCNYETDQTTITVEGWFPTLKFGIDGSTAIPVGTVYAFAGTRSAQSAGRTLSPMTAPKTIANEFQVIRLAYGMSSIAAVEKQYIDGTPESVTEAEKKGEFNRKRERTMLFNPVYLSNPDGTWNVGYRKGPTAPTSAPDTDSAMAGVWYQVKAGYTANNDSSGSWAYQKNSFNIEIDLDGFSAKLNNVSLEDVAKRRLTLITSGLRNKITVLKRDKSGVELAPNDSYGIPGVETLYWGSMTLDLMVSEALEERFPDPANPAALAVTLPFIEYRVMPGFRPHLRLNITPTNDVWTIENEFAVVESNLVHQAGTAYHGCLFPAGSNL